MRHSFLFSLSLLFALSASSFAQQPFWRQTVGPSGGEISGIAVGSKSDLYIVSSAFSGFIWSPNDIPHRVFRTTNEGKDWEEISGTLSLRSLQFIYTLLNGDIYVTERWNGLPDAVCRSRNNGKKWDTLSLNLNVATMAISPNGIFYANGGSESGNFLFRSLDSCKSWKSVQSSLMKNTSYNVSIFSFDMKGNVFVNVQKALYRSSDSGKSWVKLPTLEIFEYPLQVLSNGNLVTYGTYNSYKGLWISADDGMNWDPLNTTAGPGLIILPGDTICANYNGTIARSGDLGKTWTTIIPRASFGGLNQQFISDRDGGFYYNDVDTIIHMTKSGGVSIFPTPSASTVTSILIDDFGKSIFNGPYSDYLPALSTDGGNEWDFFPPREENCFDIWRYGKDSSGGLLAAQGRNITRSLDSGYTWKPILSNVAMGSGDIRFTTSPIGAIYAASPDKGGIFRSTDNGINWINIDAFGVNKVQMIESAPDGSIIVGADNDIFRSPDLFTYWSATAHLRDTNFHLNPNLFLRAASIKSAGVSDVIVGTDGDGAIRSTDNGATWSSLRTGAEDAKISEIVEANGGDVYALARFPKAPQIRILYLPYHSQKWYDVSFGLGNTNDVTTIAASHNGTVMVGTQSRGIFKLIHQLNVVKNFSNDPARIKMIINPNPTTSYAAITYSLSQSGITKLDLCDALGRTLVTFINGFQIAGKHEITKDLHDLSNGIYFLRLINSGKTATEKIVIEK